MAKKPNTKPAAKTSGKISTTLWLGIGAVVLIAAVLIWRAVAAPSAPTAQAGIPADVSVEQAQALVDQGALLLDVRTQEEWNEMHVPGAVLIPLDELPNRLSEVPKDQEVVVICRSGNRSKTGRDILAQNGFDDVTSVNGGIREWQAAGFPTVSGP